VAEILLKKINVTTTNAIDVSVGKYSSEK